MNKALLLMVVLAACLFSPSSVLAQGETIETRVGELSFTHDFANGYPSKETVKLLLDEMDFQRACQAYIWGIPIVAFAEWQHAHEETFGLHFEYTLAQAIKAHCARIGSSVAAG